ncbi:MAG: bifunctional DNA primase/polymerase [Phycisphaeraceae bacterium]|nr:bifunctional DNA primase/polymerase [Phycisphaeraceae bacterium]
MTTEPNSLHRAAAGYLAAGLCALPALRAAKRPAVGSWKRYRQRLPTEAELSAWFANTDPGPDAVCILCGQVSGHAEMIDFDAQGELFTAWAARIQPDLLARLVLETTQRGGRHVFYRCQGPVCGNMKLAQRRSGGEGNKVVTLIETRGEGGLFLCSPTEGYEIIQGDLSQPPVLTEAQRDVLLQAAWELNAYLPPVVDGGSARCADRRPAVGGGGIDHADRPGDDFNRRGDPRDVLEQHGWVCVRGGANAYWRRPGKASGWSATLKDGVFYVFSANAAPFEPNRAYSPFSVFALLNHDGDFEQAARSLRQLGYGSDSLPTPNHGVDISALVGLPVTLGDAANKSSARTPESSLPGDPGPMPAEMLRVPGFVNEVMDHTLATAPYPNLAMAFAGALSLLAFLAGRKVRDGGDNRTNLYLLGLAHSAAGKDWPRKVNTQIVHQVGLASGLGERFASGEGIQDALFHTPAVLFQTDEIDGLLQSINKAKDARHEAIMSTLLTMYSSANSVFPMRRKASASLPTPGSGPGPGSGPRVIDQPHLVIFGTAIPNHYYEALSERMLTNGFFARMVILEAGPRGPGQEPSIRDLPPRVLATAQWWAHYRPGKGNLEDFHPVPAVVEHSDEARRMLVDTRQQAESEYSQAEARGDPVGTTVWGRVSEQVRKLALIYAVSENHQSPHIGLAAVQWASAFVLHQTQRMLFMAAGHVAENPFHAECLKAVEKLRHAPGQELPHSVLLKRMKMDAKTFGSLIETLVQQGDIEITTTAKPGWPMRSYRLAGGAGGRGEPPG